MSGLRCLTVGRSSKRHISIVKHAIETRKESEEQQKDSIHEDIPLAQPVPIHYCLPSSFLVTMYILSPLSLLALHATLKVPL